MIRQTLKTHINVIHDLGIDETKRAENLSVQDFLSIAKKIA